MTGAGFFGRRVRGVRVLDLVALTVVLGLAAFVYFAKTTAGSEASQIETARREIAQERRATRLLQAEIAHLEQPERLKRLSAAYLQLEPLKGEHDVPPDALAKVALEDRRP